MTKNSRELDDGISNKASLLILETEASVRLAFPGAFLGYEGPCGRAERAVFSEADPHVRSTAQCVHNRAKETSNCLRNLRRLADGVAAVEFPTETPDAGTLAIKNARQALDEAERVVDVMVKELHACLWDALSPNAAEGLAALLLRRLRSLKREGTRAKNALAVSDARQAWHRAADIIQWWSQTAPAPFLRAGFKANRDLRPPTGACEVHERLAHLK